MTDLFARIALDASDAIELSIMLKATFVLGLALLATRLVRRARASVRHALLASAFGVLLALPVVAELLPPLAITVPASRSEPLMPYLAVRPGETFLYTSYWTGNARSSRPAHGRSLLVTPSTLSTLVRAGWFVGAILFLIPVAVALGRLGPLRRRGLPWLKGEPLVREIAAEAGIRRPVDILLHDDVATPLTCGFARPAIVLPSDAGKWSDVDVRQAVVHELEHVRRADWPVQLVARIVCALYWFHPLAWIAWRHLCLEAERACDDAVLGGAERTAYAEQLVTLAGRLSHRNMQPALSMANRSDLSARVTAVLDSDQARGRAGMLRAAAIAGVAALVVLAISPLRAVSGSRLQAPAAGPTFEVASVKPNKSNDGRVFFQNQPGGRFTATNVTLRMLIRQAYQLQDFQISGGPGWLNDDHFDIVAKADAAQLDAFLAEQHTGPTPIQLMIRGLLSERFNLAVHNETKDLPIYALVLARADGRLGPDLKKSEIDCAAFMAAGRGRGRGGPPPAPPAPGDRPGTPGSLGSMSCGFRIGIGNIVAGGASLSQLASSLSMFTGRVVLDKTGLAGGFDISLTWTPEQGPQRPPGAPDVAPIDPNGPSIFTALQEQLGLKLDGQRGPVEVLVIDRAEHPTPN
jgi:bla regulator protein BlaR1